jgi:hypothetical protein
MPRASAEARSAVAFHAGAGPPVPPEALTDAEKMIWRAIVSSKPIGWFDPGSLQLLEQYCGTLIEAKAVLADLRKAPEKAKRSLRMELNHLNTSCCMLATKLRLSVQAAIDRRSKMLDEKNDSTAEDKLLGGKAVWAPIVGNYN